MGRLSLVLFLGFFGCADDHIYVVQEPSPDGGVGEQDWEGQGGTPDVEQDAGPGIKDAVLDGGGGEDAEEPDLLDASIPLDASGSDASNLDASVQPDAADLDSSVEQDASLDASQDAEVQIDAGDGSVQQDASQDAQVDAEVDAGPVGLGQCEGCGPGIEEECREGFTCYQEIVTNLFVCLEVSTPTEGCDEDRQLYYNGGKCMPSLMYCAEWLEIYGSQ